MTNTTVTLDVRNWASNGADGYSNTTASNNAVYSYRYGGGSDGHGNVQETTGAGRATITVDLQSDSRYSMGGVNISGDIENQLSWQPASPTSVIITDTDTSNGSGHYSISVSDSSANCTFPCDPIITNIPPP